MAKPDFVSTAALNTDVNGQQMILKAGSGTLVNGGKTISDPIVTANSVVLVTNTTDTTAMGITDISAGSFTVSGTGGSTDTFNYLVIN